MSAAPASQIYLRSPPEPGKKSASRIYLVYFLTGNPGLIEYYRTFLTHLYGLLSHNTASDRAVEFHVFGRSLSGFQVDRADIKTLKWRKAPPYGLQDQIRHAEDELTELVEEIKSQGDGGAQDVRVILMGHSVGAYLALEIIRRLRAHGLAGDDFETRIVGAVVLFPTIVDIARSESGIKAAPFLKNASFATFIALLTSLLTCLLPTALLTTLLARFLSLPADAAHTTAAFLQSPHGVHQALHLARDEMFQIDTDIWDEEIWGAPPDAPPTPHPHPRPALRFLFARQDPWVADATRDALVLGRGRPEGVGAGAGAQDWKPVMEVDQREGWPHSFCIRHAVPVAERAAAFVRDIIARDI